jgi:hypothetical protein
MSTKTTIKRIALVAVSALGLGVVTAVAPASAASAAPTTMMVGTAVPHRVGVASVTPITFTLPTGFVAGTDTFTVAAKVTSAPSTSGFSVVGASGDTNNVASANGKKYASSSILAARISFSSSSSVISANADGSSAGTTGGAETGGNYVSTAAYIKPLSGTTKVTVNVALKADVAGAYTVMVSTSLRAVASADFASGDSSISYSVTSAGAPATITLTPISTTAAEGSTGAIVKVTLKDAAGLPTIPGTDESIDLTGTNSVTLARLDGSGGANTSLNSTSFATGVGYFRATLSAIDEDTVSVITASGGGQLLSTVTATTSITFKELAATDATTTIGLSALEETGYKAITDAQVNSDTELSVAYAKASHGITITLSAAAAADTVVGYIVTDSTGDVTGRSSTTYSGAVTIAKAAKTASFSVSGDLETLNDNFVVDLVFDGSAAGTSSAEDIAIEGRAAVNTTVAVTPALITSATGAKNTWTAVVTDQYGQKVANTAVTVSVTGRNAATATVQLATNADGVVTYSLTDAGTTGTTDQVTFTTVTDSATKTVTVTYGTSTVGSIALAGGSDLETIAGSTITAISAQDDPSTNAQHAFTATVKDANGNLLSGVPVTFALSGLASAAIVKTASADYTTVYTGSDGKATTYVFAWGHGKLTVTATAGAKTDSEYLTFGSAPAAEGRVVSVAAAGSTVTAKVVDRFGNPVSGVTVNMSRVGTGTFGNGASTQDITTDTTGTAEVTFTGAATVKAKLGATYTQAYDVAGEIDEVAVTAPVAGTTKGTGSTLAPLGVYEATVEVSATPSTDAIDAANEATDAANAATDAANAAAEAADAATAAAQDAQAAVAELATKVASLIAGIKAQITTLTNLVIKIQKKVKA